MDLQPIVYAAIGGAIGAFVTAFATLRVSARNIKLESITRERAKWREHIRCLAAAIYDVAMDTAADRAMRLDRLMLMLKLRLNPEDEKDVEIRSTVREIIAADPGAAAPLLRTFGDQIALLLKHDWQRAKREASSCPDCEELSATRRTTYEEYRYKDR